MGETINQQRRRFLAAAAASFGAIRLARAQSDEPRPMPSFEGATGWLHSKALTPADLRGRVVLVDFGTYTCINWMRTLPHLRAWAAKYQGRGAAVIVVHTPEFYFEKDPDNVRRAIQRLQLDVPIAVDSDSAIWRAFDNHYWPALYIVDAQGRIRHHEFGERGYETSEKVAQKLLREAGHGGANDPLVSVEGHGFELEADWDDLRTPETYVGYERTESFASPGGVLQGKRRVYAAPAQWKLNDWSLAGDWTVKGDAAVLNEANGRAAIRFHARDLHLVLGPLARGKAVRFRVLLDGKPPGAAHGLDVDDQGNGRVDEQRLYQLIRQPKPISDRLFEIEFLDPGVEGFVFTFG
jgi:thiol-disulfide isomerase/thioredoxin